MKNFINKHCYKIVIIVLCLICIGLLFRLNVMNNKMEDYKTELMELDHVSAWDNLYIRNLSENYFIYVDSVDEENAWDICHEIDEDACRRADEELGHPYHLIRER